MKVLKKGPDTDWGKEMRCTGSGMGKTAGCGALLLVSPSDIKEAYYQDGETTYWFVCPECSVSTYVRHNAFSSLQRSVS
jgi:hypothetical protein